MNDIMHPYLYLPSSYCCILEQVTLLLLFQFWRMALTISADSNKPPTRDNPEPPSHFPLVRGEKQHPSKAGGENASVYFIGTATTIL